MKKFVWIFFVMILMLNSCISFNHGMIKNDVSMKRKGDVSRIDGQYECRVYGGTRDAAPVFTLRNFQSNGYDRFIIKSIPLDKNRTYELQFSFLKSDSIAYSSKYKVRFKNGFLLLDNYRSRCSGIPYLFGSCEKSQSRIGLTKDGNLFIQSYYDSSGGFLLFMWTGNTMNTIEKYKRTQ